MQGLSHFGIDIGIAIGLAVGNAIGVAIGIARSVDDCRAAEGVWMLDQGPFERSQLCQKGVVREPRRMPHLERDASGWDRRRG